MVGSTLIISKHSHGGFHIGWMQRALLLSLGFLSSFSFWSHVESATNQQDINALIALHKAWNGNPFSWDTKTDPCNTLWLGVRCDATQTRVTHLLLINQGLDGTLPPAIGDLTNLTDLDLSSNAKLGGSLPSTISNLKNIETLYLQFCNFWGPIPREIGNLTTLMFFGLTQNLFSGPLPDTIGFLSRLIWFDVSSNNLNGSLFDSTTSSSGQSLGNLTLALHFHLDNNSFSGSIPASIFNTEMALIHLLLNDNKFTGTIPTNVGNLLHLQIMRFDSNALSGSIPSGISTMQNLTTLQLDNNQLSGQLFDLSNCTNLQLLYLGNNNFTAAPLPTWIKSLANLYLLSIDSANLVGNISANFFSSSPFLSNVTLAANSLNGTLDLSLANTTLQYVNVVNNQLDGFVDSNHTLEVMLGGNPFCTNNEAQCISLQSDKLSPTGSTSAPNCSNSCQNGYAINPKLPVNCQCVRPVMGSLEILATMFPLLTASDLSYMEEQFATGLSQNTFLILDTQVVVNSISATQATILIFPPNATVTWSPINASLISYGIKNFGITYPGSQGTLAMVCDYTGTPYAQGPANSGLSAGAKAGIAIMVVVLVVAIFVISLYAIKQKRRASKAEEANKPFAAWMAGGEGERSAHIPQLKGARWFSLDEIRKCTNNFSRNNEIGEGGYGKVYQACLISGEKVAIKRARTDSLQGAAEFKNEIELLSRVHHRNLVSLIGFCFEEGEQMLVYEFVPNGTLQECLSGKTGIRMNWERRISLALCSARGIAYLHKDANPAIIHGDIKSSNILLDDKLVAKVADFGLSKLAPTDDAVAVPLTSAVRGTPGYLDPAYYMTNILTDKSDVYSFGVVLLELVTGRLPIQENKYVVNEMRKALAQGGMSQVEKSMVDPELQEYPPQALEKLVELALACVQHSPDHRPSMFEVVKEIESISEPPLANLGFSPKGKYAQTQDDKLFSMQENFASTFEYSGSITGVERLLEPK